MTKDGHVRIPNEIGGNMKNKKCCSCVDWETGSPQIKEQYSGQCFKYCPWCGKNLCYEETVNIFKEKLANGELEHLKKYLNPSEELKDLPAAVVYIAEKQNITPEDLSRAKELFAPLLNGEGEKKSDVQ